MTRLLLALLLLWASPSWAAIDCADAGATHSIVDTSGSSISVSYTTPSPCVNCITIVGGGLRGTPTVDSATIGGNGMTAATSNTGTDNSRSRLFYYLNPPAGSNTVQVNFSASPLQRSIAVVTCTGVDLGDPIRAVDAATDNSTAPSVTLAGVVASDVLVDYMLANTSTSPTVGADQTTINIGNNGTNMAHIMSRQSGADGGVLSHTVVSSRWGIHGVALKAAASDSDDGGVIWLP